jgi:outer membrane protein assembly factor BamB
MFAGRMLVVACSLPFLAAARAGDWPQFRGPGNAGLSTEKRLPAEWSADKNVRWKVKLPGYGWSSPVVCGDKVFVTTAVADKQSRPTPFFFGPAAGKKDRVAGAKKAGGYAGAFALPWFQPKPPDTLYRWEVYCLNRDDGKVLWKRVAAEHKPAVATHPSNTYASETPVTDGERLYVYFGMTGVYCYDLAGRPLWNRELGAFKMLGGWGTGSSPALDGERLFVLCDNEEKSFLVALDKRTGKELWRKERPEKSSWSTPFVWHNKVRTELVACGGKHVWSHDPATGKVLWEMGGMPGMVSATPVADDERVYFGASAAPFGGRPLFAVKAGASGDLTLKEGEKSNAGVAWYNPRGGPDIASPLLYDGRLYVLWQMGGLLSCYDARTGKAVYPRQRLPQAAGFTSSPWAHAGKVFCLDEDGRTFVLQSGPEFKLLAVNRIDEMFWSSPALAGGALFLRGLDHLYCIKE